MAAFRAPVHCEAFLWPGRIGKGLIYGSRRTIFCRDCSFPCATARGEFKHARCDCLSPRRMGCFTSGSPLLACRTEPAQAVHSISGSGLPTFRTILGL